MKEKLLIGLDFGSDSVRAVLVNQCGENIATAVSNYRRWSEKMYCNATENQFRQHPLDYIESMTQVLQEVLENQDKSLVCGIGVDTTGSTPCAVDANGVPLALLPEFAENPNAMFVLWKDHTAVKEASLINQVAKNFHTDYTMYCGGCYSAEWFWAKYLHILRVDEQVRAACHGFVEHCDWIPACLTGGKVVPSRCAAGHKAMWHESWGGLPPEEFFVAIDSLLAGRRDELYTETFTADVPVGKLSAEWAEKLGLSTDVVIAGGAFDCHMGAVGASISENELVKVIGTSTCDIMISSSLLECVPGICGQVDGSVLPGMTGLEAGQSAFGDIFSWFKTLVSYGGEVAIDKLSADAEALGDTDIISLDYLNGRRTPDANQYLTGAIFNLNLGSSAPMIFKSLVESVAFGAKRIADRFIENGVAINQVTAIGGVAGKSKFVMQTCADIMGMPIRVASSKQTCATGAAMFAAVASGVYADIYTAMKEMSSGYKAVYLPNEEKSEFYQQKYQRYLKLADLWEKEVMSNVQ